MRLAFLGLELDGVTRDARALMGWFNRYTRSEDDVVLHVDGSKARYVRDLTVDPPSHPLRAAPANYGHGNTPDCSSVRKAC